MRGAGSAVEPRGARHVTAAPAHLPPTTVAKRRAAPLSLCSFEPAHIVPARIIYRPCVADQSLVIFVGVKTKISALRDEKVWGGGLFVFYHIFAYLEDAQKRLSLPDYDKLFVNKILYRKFAFEEDISHYLGSDWKTLPKSAALENYLEHLQNLEKDNPQLLMAYVYHLYLGLLSGGQILAKKRKIFGDKNLPNDMYKDKVTDFTGVDISKLKSDFRSAMNEIAEHMTVDEQNEFIDESNQVFLMNNLIVNSVGGQNKVLYNLMYKTSAVLLVVFGAVIAYKMSRA